jgi:hypothetical protein
MSYLFDKASFTANMYDSLMAHSALAGTDTDGMRLLQLLAGLTVETLMLFDSPDEGLTATYAKLSQLLGCTPFEGMLGRSALPPSYIIDSETEKGRALAKKLFEEWLTCAYDFHDHVMFVVHNVIVRMEMAGQNRAEVFRLFIECTNRCMAYEVAAQELCDIVLEHSLGGRAQWSMSECVSSLCATSGRFLALSQNACELYSKPAVPNKLDQVAYVMTQEAVRLGVPAGTDWRFGLAANDCYTSAPFELIYALEPECEAFFRVIRLHDLVDQAVAAAKAAGRMLAIASGGAEPEIEPVIAKPLAMGAMTDTYTTVCRDALILSC